MFGAGARLPLPVETTYLGTRTRASSPRPSPPFGKRGRRFWGLRVFGGCLGRCENFFLLKKMESPYRRLDFFYNQMKTFVTRFCFGFFLFTVLLTSAQGQNNGPGTALGFNGLYHYVNIPSTPDLVISNRFTIEFWFRSDDLNQFQKHLISYNGINPSARLGVIYDFANDQIEFWSNGHTGTDPRSASSIPVTDTNWHHIAYSYNGTNWVGYKDGVQVFSWTRTFVLSTLPNDWFLGAESGLGGFVKGALDEVRIWNVARTGSEISENRGVSLTGSEPGLLAYYRFNEGTGTTVNDSAVAIGNNAGTLFNDSAWITSTIPFSPTVTTAPATEITVSNAVLNGTVSPNGLTTLSFFMYGQSSNLLSSATPAIVISATNTGTVAISNVVDVQPEITYYYQLYAFNSAGTNVGTIRAIASAPDVVTLSATEIASRSATLNAGVTPNAEGTIAYFESGLSTNYGNQSLSTDLPFVITNLSVGSTISGLIPSTTYFYRVVASNGFGVVYGSNGTVTTLSELPSLTSVDASGTLTNISSGLAGNATLNVWVDPNGGVTTVYFQYGLTTNYDGATMVVNAGSGDDAVLITQLLPGLVPGLTYHYRAVISNSMGVVYGQDQTITVSNTPPTISDFGNQVVGLNTATPAIPFVIGDAETLPENLIVTAISTDTNLVPQNNLVLGGSGTNRTLTISPAPNKAGRVSIVVTVSDGNAFASKAFVLTIGEIPGGSNTDGIISQSELDAVLQVYWPNSPWLQMTNPVAFGDGLFQFSLTNTTGWQFSVEATTNLSTWEPIGVALPAFQFVDPEATNAPQRYYRLRWP